MPDQQILPPPPATGDQAPSLLDLAALARSASTPAPSRDFEWDEVVDLASWTPVPASGFLSSSPPPSTEGRGARIAAYTSVAIAMLALSLAAVVTSSRMPVAEAAAALPRVSAGIADAPARPAPVAAFAAAAVAQPVSLPSRATAHAAAPIALAPVAAPARVAAVVPVTAVAPVARAVAVAQVTPVADTQVVRVEQRAPAAVIEEPSTEVTPATVPAPVAALAPVAAPAEVAAEAPLEAPAPAAVDPDLPEVPTRESVVAAMADVRPALETCAAERHGDAPVRLMVASTGRVRNAVVSGSFVGTPEGSCIARALRGAHFPPFAQESLEISYPFTF